MRRLLLVIFFILWIVPDLFLAVYGQGSVQQLEEQVFQLNNALKYDKSQALLLPLLQDKKLTADYKYRVAILLSYTYKRVFDYQTTLKFLNIARQYARETEQKARYMATIAAEECFVLFDTHAYAKADGLMSRLAHTNFRYIDPENKSKLLMQQGYLLFLKKQYPQAEQTYDRALALMQQITPQHSPMILVKKMQLYEATNQLDRMQQAMEQSIANAQKYRILKYQLYTYEELLKLYQRRKLFPQIVQTKEKLDSLQLAYTAENHVVSLHEQKESILLKEQRDELQQVKAGSTYMLAGFGGALILLFATGYWFFVRRSWGKPTGMMPPVTVAQPVLVIPPPAIQDTIQPHPVLSERQQEVFNYLSQGLSNKEIADKMCISENTVKYHIKNIYQLLSIKDRKNFLLYLKQ